MGDINFDELKTEALREKQIQKAKYNIKIATEQRAKKKNNIFKELKEKPVILILLVVLLGVIATSVLMQLF